MLISDWSSDVCSSDRRQPHAAGWRCASTRRLLARRPCIRATAFATATVARHCGFRRGCRRYSSAPSLHVRSCRCIGIPNPCLVTQRGECDGQRLLDGLHGNASTPPPPTLAPPLTPDPPAPPPTPPPPPPHPHTH